MWSYDVSTNLELASASEHANVRPVSYDVRAVVWVYPSTILGMQIVAGLTARAQTDGRIRIAARPHRI